jgi:hypothetical protein
MLIDEFLCKREVLGKRAPHSFTPPLSVVGVSNRDKPPRGRYNPQISREILTLHPFPFLPPKNI